jgi:Glycosyl transferases group 1/Glycosyl transferase family 2
MASSGPQAEAKIIYRMARYTKSKKLLLQTVIRHRQLPAFEIPSGPPARPDLPVAVILDHCSELAFRYEWDQIPITPDTWQQQLEERKPALLFVGSSWNGDGDAWQLAMSAKRGPSQPLRDLVAWCRANAIPTVLWNTEDPPNYDCFIATAALFDYVFTVVARRIEDYRRDLGHDRINLLPFGAQPRIHNPVLRGLGRRYDVAFAGTYVADKHPKRREQMNYLCAATAGLDIYSRMENNGDSRYQFPVHLSGFVVGSLEYERMVAAYTAYKVFLNVNSITESATMCTRRLFELSAAQTAVVSTPAATIEPFFGDTVTVVDDEKSANRAIQILVNQHEHRDRLALRAHRRVFDEHLYTHRVGQVLAAVGIADPANAELSISAVVSSKRPQQLTNVMAFVGRQVHTDLELILVTHGFVAEASELKRLAECYGVDRYSVISADATLTLGDCMNLGIRAAGGQYVAKMDDDNWYGSHYLSDLIRAFSWTDAQVVGKWAHYVYLRGSNATLLRFSGAEHRYVELVQGGTIMAPRSVMQELPMENLPRRVDTTFLDKVRVNGGKIYSADRFNFISIRSASGDGHTWSISDDDLLVRKSSLQFYGDPCEHVRV